jgi:sec-independent protein translocase protein TatA
VFGIGPEELIVILVIALIVFGPKRLPEIGRTLGRSLQEFRKASNEIREHLQVDLADEPADAPKAASTPSGVDVTAAAQSVDSPSGPQQGSSPTASQAEPGTNGQTPSA